ncbi:hypothetical protein EGW08_023093 [Elysia chlorotica]|uniref:Chloride channel CLIC-like protein 1 n=1 Tax=Elysia chlorotica TaxID=188477 RepID=A0A3S0ZJW6_ELYCH|nr:hypothetical protein EGW08_023093 [Elysia chlorotica]
MSELNMARVWIIFAYIICLASFMVIAESSNDNFIDPMDMLNFDSVNMRMKDKSMTQEPLDKTTCCSGEKCPPCNEASLDACLKIQGLHDTSTLLLRQYSMSLVKLMESKISSTSYPTLLDLRVRVTYHGLTKLRKFGEGSSSDFHALHETLTNFMQYAKPVSEESIFPRLYWLEDKLGLSFSMMAHITVLIISSLLLVVTISHLRLSKELVWRTLISVFFISVAMTMVEMYQGKVAEQEELLMTSARKHCPKAEEMSVWEKIFTYVTSHISFEDDDCKKYMEAILVNPLVTVNPLQAVAVAVVKTVVTPMEMIGQGIRNFLIGLLKGLPLQIQTFVLICLFCLLILWPLLLMGYNFNFCYLINIGPQRVVEKIQVSLTPFFSSLNPIHMPCSNIVSVCQG